MKLVLMEDDKAPDAREVFTKRFDEITGGDFKKLITMGATQQTDMCLNWDITTDDKEFLLTWCCDEPFYVLYEEKGAEAPNMHD